MSFRKQFRGPKGFSLVELMIVVAIIGVLAALAVPRFQSFQAKARQSEAKNNLSHIYTLEQSYYGDNDTFIVLPKVGPGPTAANCKIENSIGFYPQPCSKVRYGYEILAADVDANKFKATATADSKKIVPGCSAVANDIWAIDESKELAPTTDAVIKCN